MLLQFDADLAAEVRRTGVRCRKCDGPLHKDRFPRKPRGPVGVDKAANADGLRRTLEPPVELAGPVVPAPEMPPLLAKLVAAQADTGLPPAYLPKDERQRELVFDADAGTEEEGAS